MHARQSQEQLAPFDPALRDVQGMDSQQGRASLFGGTCFSFPPTVGLNRSVRAVLAQSASFQ